MRPNSGFWSTNTLILSPTHLQSETIKFLVNKPREHHEQRCFPFHKSVFRTSFQSRPLFSAPFRRLRAWPLSREEKQGFDFHDIGQQTTRNRERGRATLGERREKVPTRSEKNTHPVPFPFCSRGKFPSRVRKKEESLFPSLGFPISRSDREERGERVCSLASFFPVPSLLPAPEFLRKL